MSSDGEGGGGGGCSNGCSSTRNKGSHDVLVSKGRAKAVLE